VASAQGAAVADAFAALAPRHREVLALAFAGRVPHAEIAEVLGCRWARSRAGCTTPARRWPAR
jgi:DNA-directed RNA polymerase specialized sigma24 family protein